MKPLEALDIMAYKINMEGLDVCICEETQIEAYNLIEKHLKALEIIKEKQVDIGLLIACETEPEYLNRCCNRYWTNDKCGWKRLSQEEFDLIKEVLKDYEK